MTAELDGVDLRYVTFGGLEVVRRVYVAVRDHNWDTIPAEIANLEVTEGDGSFRIGFDAHHRGGDIDFSWHGAVTASADDTVTVAMDGVADSAFRYNRIGICLLHPPNVSGRPFRARTESGELHGTLPREIGPQLIADGLIHPLFDPYTALELAPLDGVHTSFEFEGDLFEMEDQRNWTDASFKTYSTPLALGFPHQAEAGQRIAQKLTLRVEGDPPPYRGDASPTVTLGPPLGRPLPRLGLGLASHGRSLGALELELVRQLAPDHLRVDLHLGAPGWRVEFERASAEAAALGTGLELALFLESEPEAELAGLADALADAPRIVRVLVFRRGEASTEGHWVRLAREALATTVGEAAIAGGTNAYFTDLNRGRPETAAMDAIVFSVNPQVHAFDEASLVETCSAQADVVRSARAFSDGRPIVVSPVTLQPRFNPNATGPEGEPPAGELPSQVDARQCSLFGAAWTVGSVKYLAEAGTASVTYYETSGWRGVLERPEGTPLPERFLSRPGRPFPLYHVLADLGEWKGGELAAAVSSDALVADAIAVRSDGALHALVANMTPEPQQIRVEGTVGARARVRILDAASAAAASERPGEFRADGEERDVADGVLDLQLGPYAIARLDTGGAA